MTSTAAIFSPSFALNALLQQDAKALWHKLVRHSILHGFPLGAPPLPSVAYFHPVISDEAAFKRYVANLETLERAASKQNIQEN